MTAAPQRASATARPLIWLIGDCRLPEFAEAWQQLSAVGECRPFDRLPDASASQAVPAAEPTRTPVAIVLLESRPGEFARGDVERLHRRLPLAQLVGVRGPWSQGERRGPSLIPGVHYFGWNALPTVWSFARGMSQHSSPSAVPLPRTATAVEQILHEAEHARRGRPMFDGLAEIYTLNRLGYESLAGGIEALGGRAVWKRSAAAESAAEANAAQVESPALRIFDGWQMIAPPATCNATPVDVLLLPFARPEDHHLAASRGIPHLLAPPFRLAELWKTICGQQETQMSPAPIRDAG